MQVLWKIQLPLALPGDRLAGVERGGSDRPAVTWLPLGSRAVPCVFGRAWPTDDEAMTLIGSLLIAFTGNHSSSGKNHWERSKECKPL